MTPSIERQADLLFERFCEANPARLMYRQELVPLIAQAMSTATAQERTRIETMIQTELTALGADSEFWNPADPSGAKVGILRNLLVAIRQAVGG